MFGFNQYDSHCHGDLWAPSTPRYKDIVELEATNFLDAIDETKDLLKGYCRENRAFSGYAKHTQEIEDTINTIVDKALAAGGSGLSGAQFSIELDDDFSDEDLEYIKKEVQRRL